MEYIHALCIHSALSSGDAKATLQYNRLSPYFSVLPSILCADGPIYKYYNEEGYFFWPPIIYRRCDGLICQRPKLRVPIHACVKHRWAVVYKCNKFGCRYVGIHFIRHTEHLDCHSKCDIYQCCSMMFHFNSNLCKCVSDIITDFPIIA